MLSFLFEQYGYYPKDFIDNSFTVNEWIFKLIETDYDLKKIDEIDNYILNIRDTFDGEGPFIIKTRSNQKISYIDNKKYVLISVKKRNLSLKDLNKFHCLFFNNKNFVDLKNLLSTWKSRIEYIEKDMISTLRIDSVYYNKNLEVTLFCLGIAQNAIQYLNDIILDYDDKIENITITHKRMSDLNSFDFFNPLNFIEDHPIRDIVDLYQNNFITFTEFVSFVEYYQLDNKTASLFMARLLYPAKVFDLLEENANKKETGFRIQYNIQKELCKFKKIYLFLKEKYNIRPINWLDY